MCVQQVFCFFYALLIKYNKLKLKQNQHASPLAAAADYVAAAAASPPPSRLCHAAAGAPPSPLCPAATVEYVAAAARAA